MSQCNDVVISSPNLEILDWCNQNNIPAIKTSPDHERATDRAEETLTILESQGKSYSHVILIQGDEPQVHPDDIDLLIDAFKLRQSEVINLIYEIKKSEADNKDIVKVVLDKDLKVLTFSRARIPHNANKFYRQLGMIAFSSNALRLYKELEPTALEIIESIDMMRFLENDIDIQALVANYSIVGVDRPEDLEIAQALMDQDDLLSKYNNISE